MSDARRTMTKLAAFAALGTGVVVATGCQTPPAGFGGMTLPSPHYLKHYPQYFAPDPTFPLQRERDSQLDPTGEIRRGAPQGGLPGAVPVPGQFQPPGPAVGPAGPGGGGGIQ